MYKIAILEKAQSDLDWFRRNDKSSYIKCFDLVRELMSRPREGKGKPERLKYFEKEVYSRRVNHKDRLIYSIYEEYKEIDITDNKNILFLTCLSAVFLEGQKDYRMSFKIC